MEGSGAVWKAPEGGHEVVVVRVMSPWQGVGSASFGG